MDGLFDAVMVGYQIADCTAEQEIQRWRWRRRGVVGMVAARNRIAAAPVRAQLSVTALRSLRPPAQTRRQRCG
jgi:hypothetical protein